MKKIILISILMILSLSSCSARIEYVYIKPEPFDFKVNELPKEREIRVHPRDMELYKGYITQLRKHIDFYILQIKDYKESFTKDNK